MDFTPKIRQVLFSSKVKSTQTLFMSFESDLAFFGQIPAGEFFWAACFAELIYGNWQVPGKRSAIL
jgi:hypothetical protein